MGKDTVDNPTDLGMGRKRGQDGSAIGDLMVRTYKKKVAEEYSSIVSTYSVASMATREEGEHKLRALICEGDVVLDVGCGPGFGLPLSLCFAGRGGMVVAVDISLDMLREARRNVERWEFPSRRLDRKDSQIRGLDKAKPDGVTPVFLLCDAERLPFREGKVDVAFSFEALHRMDPEVGIREMYRAIRPGGYMLVEIPAGHDEDAMVFQHIPPSYLPSTLPKGFPPDFKLDPDYWEEEQSRWRQFKDFCRKRLPCLSDAISRGWFNGYRDLRSRYNQYVDGEIDQGALEKFIEQWEEENRAGRLKWICFPTRSFFSHMVSELEEEGAMVIECSTSSFKPDLISLSRDPKLYFEFYTYTYSQVVRTHVAVLSKPDWAT